MSVPEGFTHRGDGNEQPPETYDKWVALVFSGFGKKVWDSTPANTAPWKVPDGADRIHAYKVLP